MKNKSQSSLHKFMGFIRGELEITLAVLVLLALIVGSTFAQTPAVSPDGSDVSASATEVTSSIVYNTNTYKGITFGLTKAGYLRVKTLSSAGSAPQYSTADGLTLVDPESNYRFELKLDTALDGTAWYLDYDGTNHIDINGSPIISRTQPLDLSGATTITIVADGGTLLRSLSHTAPGATPTVAPIASLFVAPTSTIITVGATRTFISVATDSENNSVNVSGIVSWTSSNSKVATVNATTGLVTAVAPGTVTITAKAGTASASATVSVETAPATISIPNTSPTATKENSWGASWGQTSTTAPTTGTTTSATSTPTTETLVANAPVVANIVDSAVASLFSDTAVAQRFNATGSTHPAQAEIKSITASLPTATQKISFTIRATVAEVATTLKEIAFGRTVIDPSTGKSITKPSAPKIVASFIGQLIFGDRGANAGTLKAGPEDADLE